MQTRPSIVSLAIVLQLVGLISGHLTNSLAASIAPLDDCSLKLIDSLTNECVSFHLAEVSIDSIGQYVEFFQQFAKFRQSCLTNGDDDDTKLGKQFEEQIQAAELICEQNGFYYGQMQQFYQLIRRIQSEESICNIEFTMKLYHFHEQVQQHLNENPNGNNKISQLFHLLANSVATKCRLSLAIQLHDIERIGGVPIAMALAGLLGLAFIGPKEKPYLQNDQLAFGETELFVPILERELPEHLFDPISSSLAQTGATTFKLDDTRDLILSKTREFCKQLKLYHVNTLGSLGLLASLGYASPFTIHGRKSLPLDVAELELARRESKSDQLIIQRWLLTALLCQPLRNILQTVTVNGYTNEQSRAIQFVPTREPDVYLKDERAEHELQMDESNESLSFSSVRPSEESNTGAQRILERLFHGAKFNYQNNEDSSIKLHAKQLVDYLAKFKFTGTSSIIARKLHLLNGPSYRLSRAMLSYLTSKLKPLPGETRLDLIESIIGTKLVSITGA